MTAMMTRSSLTCPPRWGTERTGGRKTYGAAAGKVAEALGLELMPWQQHVLDVALEVNPETGKLAYRHVGLSVPRQAGKSTLTLVLMTLRCMAFGSGQQVIYTAQDRMSAREKWEEDHVEKLRAARGLVEDRHFSVRLSNGSERIRFGNGSIWRISSTTATAGHGKTLDLAVIDEAFSHSDTRIDQSFATPMITRPQPQLWVVSTAGTSDSLYLNGRRESGRAAAERGDTTGVCWFEWSAPDDADLWDRGVWRSTHPALGHTIDEDVLAGEIAATTEADAKRAYLNITDWGSKGAASPISPADWERQVDPQSHIDGRAVIGVAMTPDRGQTALSVAGRRVEGDLHVDHVKTAAGSDWVVAAVTEMIGNFPEIAGVSLDAGGPASSLIADLEVNGVTVFKQGARSFAQACGMVADGVRDQKLWHRGQPAMNQAVGRARSRPLGDLWAWVRGNGDESIAELEAATVAVGAVAALVESDSGPELVDYFAERGGLFKWDD